MERVKIKKEKLPKRCEICHLEDKFEAINNFCHRCSNISVERNISNTEKKIYKDPTLEINLVKNVFALIVSGVLAVTLSVFLFVSLEVYVSEYLRGVLIFLLGFCQYG